MKYLILTLLSTLTLVNTFSHSHYQAPPKDSLSLYSRQKKDFKIVTNYGIFLGIGAGLTSFSELNQTLTALHIQTVDNILFDRTIGITAGNDLVALQFRYSKYMFYRLRSTRYDRY